MGGMSESSGLRAATLRAGYSLCEELGQGGFSTVFRARQVATGQDVAIKALKLPEEPGALDKRLARFQREMQLCAQLHHPNIVRLIDSGQSEREVYTVFEFVPGKNLAQVLATEGRLEPAEARHLMLQVLDALACAHARGVVHRDLKPANLMVVSTGARRNALVLDFGIGGFSEEGWREQQPRLTLTSEAVGTPAYAAPEQLRGQAPTPRSDLYAWGLVFLECLTGQRVIQGETVAEAMFSQLSPEPIALPAMLRGHPLGRLLQRVTVKDAATRDVTAAALLHELEACDVRGLWALPTPSRLQPAAPDARTETLEARRGEPRSGGGATPSAPRSVEGERRQVTSLCCGLSAVGVGPRPLDPEEHEQLLGALQDACTHIARQFGGDVTGTLGDTVLFHFGYPVAREDDARRAARAALAIMAELRARGAELVARGRVRVEARLGLHTGLVVTRGGREPVSTGAGALTGTTPRLAARLCALAQPDSILVSGETWRLLRRHFALREDGSREVDGSSMPMEVYLLREGSPATDTDASGVPLVGRSQELEALLGHWAQVRGGVGQAVLLSGEPGIGKSRLVREVGERLRAEGATWLECRCTPDGVNTPFFAITDMVARLLDPGSEAAAELKVKRLDALLERLGFELAEAMPLFTTLLSLPLPARWSPLVVTPQQLRELTRDAVLALLFELAAQQPVGLLIEDLHWADPSTVELLNQLVGEVAPARVLALFCARPDFAPTWPATAVRVVQLGRLGRAEVEQIAARVSGGRPLPERVLDEVVVRADGVPLFIEELVRSMMESGALVEREGRFTLARALSEVRIPSALRDLLAARLDRLERARETAQVASVIGREFSLELLRAVSPLDEASLQQDLDRLIAAELVYRKRRLKGSVYLFKHALVQDAAYDAMLKRSRQQVHARIAQALGERFPEVARERPELVAHHHAAAEQFAEALHFAHRAALAAQQRGANLEALAHAREALGWLEAIGDARARARHELDLNGIIAPALMATQGFSGGELETVLHRSLGLIDTAGEGEHVFPTLWALSVLHYGRGQLDSSLEFATRLLELTRKAGDVSREVAARVAVGQAYYALGRFEGARAELTEALRLYEPRLHRDHTFVYGLDSRIHALGYLGTTLAALGQLDEAVAVSDEAEAWSRELRNQHSTSAFLFGRSCTFHLLGMRERIPPLSDQLRELVQAHGFSFFLPLVELLRAWAEGNLEAAQGLLSSITQSGGVSALGLWTSMVAELLAGRGRRQEALELLQDAIARHDMASTYYLAEMFRLKGELLGAEDAVAAEVSLREAVAQARAQGARFFELRACRALATLLVGQGRKEEARHILQPVLSGFPEAQAHPELLAARALLDDLRSAPAA